MLREAAFSVAGVVCLFLGQRAAHPEAPLADIQLPQATDKRATLTFEQLRDGVRQYYKGIQAIDVEFIQNSAVASFDSASGKLKPQGEHHFAFKGEKRLASRSFPPRGKPNGPLSPEMTVVFSGDISRQYMPASRLGTIQRSKSHTGDINAYMHALGIPVSDNDRSHVSNTTFFLPSALDRADLEWKVSPRLEMVDGAECHVLETKYRQRIWIDPKLGYAMRFRERYWPVKDKPISEWPLGERTALGNYRQLTNGVWLPERIEAVQYAAAQQPQNFWNQVSRRSIVQATRLAVNDQVPDNLFTLSFPPGTIVNDKVRNRVYRIGKSNEELEVIVANGQEELLKSASSRRTWLIAANLIAIAAIASVFVYRQITKRRRRAGH